MSRMHIEKAFTWFLLLFFIVMLFLTWGYAPRARLVPLALLVPATLLITWQLWQNYHAPATTEERAGEGEEDSLELGAPFDQEMRVLAWFAGAVALLWLLGFLIAVPLFLAAFLRRWGRESWLLSLSVAGLVTLGMYLSLEVGFHLVLYRGWLFSYLS